MSDWRPIETAPKDGTHILGWGRYNNFPVIVRWGRIRHTWEMGWEPSYDGSRVIESESDFGTEYKEREILTHWMPLPERPESGDA